MNLLFPMLPVNIVGYWVLKPELSISIISASVFSTYQSKQYTTTSKSNNISVNRGDSAATLMSLKDWPPRLLISGEFSSSCCLPTLASSKFFKSIGIRTRRNLNYLVMKQFTNMKHLLAPLLYWKFADMHAPSIRTLLLLKIG